MDRLFRQDNLDKWYKPLVVFANSNNTLDLKNAPKSFYNKVLKSENLVELLKKDYKECDKDLLVNKKAMESTAYSIMKNYHKTIQVDYIKKYESMVIENKVIENNQEKREKLVQFRKEKAKNRNIPEEYIFSDDELERIMQLKPKNIEELIHSKILSDIKIKYHGDEIVSILEDDNN